MKKIIVTYQPSSCCRKIHWKHQVKV